MSESTAQPRTRKKPRDSQDDAQVPPAPASPPPNGTAVQSVSERPVPFPPDPAPPAEPDPSQALELFRALHWLCALLIYRLGSHRVDNEATLAGLEGLLEELRETAHEAPLAFSAPPPLPRSGWIPSFSQRFRLNALEALIVVAGLAPAIDGRFAQAYGRFQGLDRPERPTVDVLGRLLAFSLPERNRLASFAQSGGRLEQYGLVRLDWSPDAALPVHVQPLIVPDRLRWFLLEGPTGLPAEMHTWARLKPADAPLSGMPLPESLHARLEAFLTLCTTSQAQGRVPPTLLLEGPWGTGQLEAAQGIAHHLGLAVLEVELGPLLSAASLNGLSWGGQITALRREAILQQALPLLHIQSDDQNMDTLQRRATVLIEHELRDLPFPLLASGNLATLVGLRELERPCLRLELRLPERRFQRQAITQALDFHQVTAQPEAIEALLNRYNLDLLSSVEVVRTARALANSARDQAEELTAGELESAVELILRRHLGQLSQRLSARFGWDDLVLPTEVINQLQTLRNLIEHRHLVFEEWGLGRKASGGRGIKALFSGPSGTGKTMAAEVIASDLRLPLYRVDLSAVVSKWVGETEKNLEKIFREAQGSQAILLFDEADSLFGQRGKVDNANDRHANLEVSFLLQRFEVHDGVVILTSNFPSVIDEAFSRRMHFLVDFPEPDEDIRRTLWEKLLIPTLPQQDDIDIEFLAQRFEITGANIKNVVMGAAFQSAASGRPVGMREIAVAMQWEYQKLGRSVSISDFSRFDLYEA